MTESTNQSLNSMMQQLEQYTKMGIDLSPYLSAIQSLDGKTPGEKYKELNRIVREIVRSKQTLDQPADLPESKQLPAAIIPLVNIRVGNALRSSAAVIEALMSEDIPVTNQAFRARWFFKGSNEFVTADYFTAFIIPFVSKRTRFKIIKALSYGLRGHESKAEDFYRAFVALYGVQEALPLLYACSEKYIRAEVMQPNLFLSYRVLVDLYQKHPDLVVDCLRQSARNQCYSQHVEPQLVTNMVFGQFLPHLIRRNIDVFIELYNPRYYVKIGSTNADLFFKQAADVVVKKATLFEKLFDLKIICKKLTLQQFEGYFANFFPDDKKNFELPNVLKLLKYYPKEKRAKLLESTYEAKYSVELSISGRRFSKLCKDVHDKVSVELFEKLFLNAFPTSFDKIDFQRKVRNTFEELKYSREKTFVLLDKASTLKCEKSLFHDIFSLKISEDIKRWLVGLYPPHRREIQVVKFLATCEEKTNEYYDWYVIMPPKKSLPFFKDAIAKSSNDKIRQTLIKKMAESLTIDCNNNDLKVFLQYYNKRHKNEKVDVLRDILDIFREKYDLKKVTRQNWNLLFEILQRAHTKGELKHLMIHDVEIFFDTVVIQMLVENTENLETIKQEDHVLLNNIFQMLINFNFVSDWQRKWMFARKSYILNRRTPESVWKELKKLLIVQKYCFEKLMELFVQKYPPEHPFFQKKKELAVKCYNAIAIMENMHYFNKHIDKVKKYHDPECDIKKLFITDYPWVIAIIKDVLMIRRSHIHRRQLQYEMNNYEPKLLEELEKNEDSDDTDLDINVKSKNCEIKTGKALVKLNKTQWYVFDRFEDYLKKCRELLKCNTKNGGAAARRFLLATKWHKDLPSLIIENCLRDVKGEGNLKVLGIMLEGDVFSKLVTPFAPSEASVDIHHADSKDHYALVQMILPAMNLPSPPVSFDAIVLFCQGEYVKLAAQTLTNTSERVTKSKIESFAERLIDKPISVKKHGIRLIFKVALKADLESFIREMWKNEKHSSIREMITSLVKRRFIGDPSGFNWMLMLICIDAVTEKDDVPIAVLTNVEDIKNKYTSEYISELLKKIEEMPEPEKEAKDNVSSKSKWIANLFKNAAKYNNTSKLLTKELILEIIRKYCFLEPSAATAGLLSSAEAFAKNVFTHPFSTKNYKFCFTENKRDVHFGFNCNRVPRT